MKIFAAIMAVAACLISLFCIAVAGAAFGTGESQVAWTFVAVSVFFGIGAVALIVEAL